MKLFNSNISYYTVALLCCYSVRIIIQRNKIWGADGEIRPLIDLSPSFAMPLCVRLRAAEPGR